MSDWASAVLFALRKDGSVRFCIAHSGSIENDSIQFQKEKMFGLSRSHRCFSNSEEEHLQHVTDILRILQIAHVSIKLWNLTFPYFNHVPCTRC